MRKGEIVIKLNSDLCVGDGSVYNSTIDTDVCKDEYGLPFIPAKRIRGCLRECAVELADWGMEINVNELFGAEGDKRAKVRIGNAYLNDYDEIIREIKENSEHAIFHPETVLRQFTYLRTQTAIDNETGTADATTLRTIRVVNKGLTFIAQVFVMDDTMTDIVTEQMVKCCSVLRHMGIARTRGLGEVQVSYIDKGNLRDVAHDFHKSYSEGADKLTYTIKLLEPMILKSVNGGEENTQDYVEGSKVLGLVAQAMKDCNQYTADFFSGSTLFFSNAYIAKEGMRFTEVPAVFYSVKNHKDEYRNKLYDSKGNRETVDKDLQLNQMKHCYAIVDESGGLRKLDVNIEERYHHRRPDDKSIGRALAKESDNANFYQISSISAGQTFEGFIAGTAEEIKKIYDALSNMKYIHMGYGRSSEYGFAEIQITKVEKQGKASLISGKDFAVKLEAPTIVYNKNAYYSINSADLIEEIREALNINCEVSAKFINYVTIGGYNVTWNRRKPTIDAFGAGTVIVFHSDDEQDILLPPILRLGERTMEGFGEATVQAFDPVADRYIGTVLSDKDEKMTGGKLDVADYPFAKQIADRLFGGFIRSEAARAAKIYFEDKREESVKPTISDLTLMTSELKQQENLTGAYTRIKAIAEKRYGKDSERKKKKLKKANEILEKVQISSLGVLKNFAEQYMLENYTYDDDNLFLQYLEAFLMHGKYLLHDHSRQNSQEGKEYADEQ